MKRLRPLRETPEPCPQCEAPFDSSQYLQRYREYRERRIIKLHPNWNVNQCGRSASYEINGKFLCSNHAGQEAIKTLLENQND